MSRTYMSVEFIHFSRAKLSGAQLSTFSGWTIGPRRVGPWGRNPPIDIYPPIVGRIYPIPVCIPQMLAAYIQYEYEKYVCYRTLLCITSTELYSQNFGSLYPIQVYISKCTFPNPAPKSSN